jgi:hypothetical protein
MRAATDVWTADLLDGGDHNRKREHERMHDEVPLTRDAVLVSANRLVRYFVFEGPREPGELDPSGLVPGWEPPVPATKLRSFLHGMSEDSACITGLEKQDWPFATILTTLLEVAENFSWDVGARDPDAAQHLDHNLAELRERLR